MDYFFKKVGVVAFVRPGFVEFGRPIRALRPSGASDTSVAVVQRLTV